MSMLSCRDCHFKPFLKLSLLYCLSVFILFLFVLVLFRVGYLSLSFSLTYSLCGAGYTV